MAHHKARVGLKASLGERDTYVGVYHRMGTKPGHAKRPVTILLLNIKNRHGAVVADHLWINRTKGVRGLGPLRAGDRIRFDARVRTYSRGGDPRWIDYQLSYPTQFVLLPSRKN